MDTTSRRPTRKTVLMSIDKALRSAGFGKSNESLLEKSKIPLRPRVRRLIVELVKRENWPIKRRYILPLMLYVLFARTAGGIIDQVDTWDSRPRRPIA